MVRYIVRSARHILLTMEKATALIVRGKGKGRSEEARTLARWQ